MARVSGFHRFLISYLYEIQIIILEIKFANTIQADDNTILYLDSYHYFGAYAFKVNKSLIRWVVEVGSSKNDSRNGKASTASATFFVMS